MTQLQQIQPNLPDGFETQNSISLQLFILVLNTARTRQELERAWEALAEQEELVDQIRNARQQNYMYMYMYIYIFSYLFILGNVFVAVLFFKILCRNCPLWICITEMFKC